jgi:GDP-L-fucose synthase
LDNYDEVSIKVLAELIASIVGYGGQVSFGTSKPDGTPRKLMDSSRLMALGWRPEIPLESGIKQTYDWFLKSNPSRATLALGAI